jgi:hypothetical protein
MQRRQQFYEYGLDRLASTIGDGEVAISQAGAMIIRLYDHAKLTAEEDLPPANNPLNVHGDITLA